MAVLKETSEKEKIKKQKKRKRIAGKIKKDLLSQLSQKKLKETHYLDLVDDYISLFEIKNKLIDDIDERGVKVEYKNGQNQWGCRKNDSVTELTRINSQMLKLLDDLGLKASSVEVVDDEDEL